MREYIEMYCSDIAATDDDRYHLCIIQSLKRLLQHIYGFHIASAILCHFSKMLCYEDWYFHVVMHSRTQRCSVEHTIQSPEAIFDKSIFFHFAYYRTLAELHNSPVESSPSRSLQITLRFRNALRGTSNLERYQLQLEDCLRWRYSTSCLATDSARK